MRSSMTFVLLDANAKGYTVQHCRVDYDRESVSAAIDQVQHPASNYMIDHLQGEFRAVFNRMYETMAKRLRRDGLTEYES